MQHKAYLSCCILRHVLQTTTVAYLLSLCLDASLSSLDLRNLRSTLCNSHFSCASWLELHSVSKYADIAEYVDAQYCNASATKLSPLLLLLLESFVGHR